MKLYSRLSDHETILELWGGSSKHPDCVYKYSDFLQVNYFPPEEQIFQWILECASHLTFPPHAYRLTKQAIEIYEERERLLKIYPEWGL